MRPRLTKATWVRLLQLRARFQTTKKKISKGYLPFGIVNILSIRSPLGKMPARPTCDQFRSFEDTCIQLEGKSLKCMWYLPAKQRSCSNLIAKDEHQQLRSEVKRLPQLPMLRNLEKIAEYCCCARYHRDTMWGSGLARDVALRWLNDKRTAKGLPRQETDQGKVAIKPVVFAKYQAFPDENLLSTLRSDLDLNKYRTGSLYIYTYQKNKAFEGMIKIGYTGRSVRTRLKEWAKCGHGEPKLLNSVGDVRHPERVEALTHLQLLDYWHRQRWCNIHFRSHIEWFKVDPARAHTIANLWSNWMTEAEPYDSKKGFLKPDWSNHIDFLIKHDNPVTAETMILIYEIERGSGKLQEFIDDNVLHQTKERLVKKEDEQ